MKKIATAALLLMLALTASAQQQIRIWQSGNDTRVPIGMDEITYSADGSTVSIGGKEYATASIDSITMVHTITVTYSDNNTALVEKGNVLDVECEVKGADVVITNNNTFNEVEVVLQGSSTNGSLTYYGSYKCKFYLNGLNLTSQTTAALDIQCGKRIDLILCPGTVNTLADAATGTQKAALYCKGHLEVEGSGTLNVSGNARHAIATKEYLQLKKSTGTINIVKAASDAMHLGQYFLMSGGTVKIDGNTMADGIQVDRLMLDDDVTPDASKADNGKVFIKGGSIEATITHEDCKALKCEDFIEVSGGTINMTAQGNGSRGIQTDGNMAINDGTITIKAAGGLCTQPACSDDPHRCMGIKVDGNLKVTGGVTKVANSGNKARAIKCGTYTKTGGTVQAVVTQG